MTRLFKSMAAWSALMLFLAFGVGFTPSEYDITTFGVKCDGVTDDGANVTKAIAAVSTRGGTTLRWPAGTCLITTMPVQKSKIRHIGAGIDATTLKLGSSQISIFGNADSSGNALFNVDHILISDMTMDGNYNVLADPSNDNLAYGVYFADTTNTGFTAKNIVVERVRFKNFWYNAVEFYAVEYGALRDLEFVNVGDKVTYLGKYAALGLDNAVRAIQIERVNMNSVGGCVRMNGAVSPPRNAYDISFEDIFCDSPAGSAFPINDGNLKRLSFKKVTVLNPVASCLNIHSNNTGGSHTFGPPQDVDITDFSCYAPATLGINIAVEGQIRARGIKVLAATANGVSGLIVGAVVNLAGSTVRPLADVDAYLEGTYPTGMAADINSDDSNYRLMLKSTGTVPTGITVNGSRNRFSGGAFIGTFTAKVTDSGTATKFNNNTGFVLRNNGNANIADGGTITHGLDPNYSVTYASVTPQSANVCGAVTATSSTTITVALKNCATGAGSGATDVYWEVANSRSF